MALHTNANLREWLQPFNKVIYNIYLSIIKLIINVSIYFVIFKMFKTVYFVFVSNIAGGMLP